MVRYGLAPMRTLQAATLNAAIRLGRPDLGLVAPGKRADLVLFDDLEGFNAKTVIRDGKIIEAETEISAPPASLMQTCKIPAIKPEDFTVPAQGPFVRIATIDRPRFTEWGEARAKVERGIIVPPEAATMLAVTHRHGKQPAKPRVGFLRGWGKWQGAFATTVSHDSHNLAVFGGNTADMAIAANALIDAGGGMAVAQDGELIAILPLPVAGLVSTQPLSEVAASFSAVKQAMDSVVTWEPPYLVFKALVGANLACNAGPHQSDMGIADSLAGKLLESPILEDGLS